MVRPQGKAGQERVNSVCIPYAGRLRYFYNNWLTVTANPILLEWVQGYRLPLISFPGQLSPPTPKTLSLVENNQMRKEINDLLKIGAISRCDPLPGQFVSSFFLVDKPNGKKRFILNLKNLNAYISAPHFKMEDARTVARLIQRNWYAASVDLKDAYYLLPVHEQYRKFLRFSFNKLLYEFNCLVFGLASAPYTFSKLMRPVIQDLRSKGIPCINYLDDFLILGRSKEECAKNVRYVTTLLTSLGFLINVEKSSLDPSTRCKFLGFIFDSVDMTISLPTEKRERILRWVSYFLSHERCKILCVAQFIGLLTSACPAVKYGWVYTKNFERAKCLALISSQGDYNTFMHITSDLIPDLLWWRKSIGVALNDLKNDSFYLEICTDASLSGWGAVCNGEHSYGWWKNSMRNKHINFLELQAIFLGLMSFASELRHKNILIRTDNTTALASVNKMGSVQYPHLNVLARNIWHWCETRHLWIFASYISSRQNWQADQASRTLPSTTEWSLNAKVFSHIVDTFGLPEIDLFASIDNHKCYRYVSWVRDPGAEAVDAFTIDWKNFTFYAFPPFSLILRVLQKIVNDQATGILVVPFWQSQSWYPLFLKLMERDPLFFGPSSNLLFSPYSNATHPLSKDLILVVAKLSGKLSN